MTTPFNTLSLQSDLVSLCSNVRKDAYAERFLDDTGKYGYRRVIRPIDVNVLQRHLNDGPHVGVYLMASGETNVSVAVLDLDDHSGDVGWEKMCAAARGLLESAGKFGMRFAPSRSGGGKGIHLFLKWDEPQSAAVVRQTLATLLAAEGFAEGTGGIAKNEIEIFPKQSEVTIEGYGSLIALPFGRLSLPLDQYLKPIERPELWLTSAPLAADPTSDLDEIDTPGIVDALKYLPADEYTMWVKVGLALKRDLKDEGLAVWDQWAAKSKNYCGQQPSRKKWLSFRPRAEGIGLGSVLFWAQENGWRGQLKRWPEFIDFTAGHDAVPPFPTHLLPEPFATFVADEADRMQVPAEFVGIPLIVSFATMLGQKVRLAPKRHDDWSERPCVWGLVIAPSGSRKSPAADAALRFIKLIQRELWETYQSELIRWRADRDSPERGDEPKLETILTNEATVEALVGLMSEQNNKNPNGILLARDELSGWYSTMNKYRSTGDDRQFYLECYSGGSFRTDRKGAGPTLVSDLYLSIYGTIQPAIAADIFRGGDRDGLLARFGLVTWPSPREHTDFVDQAPNLQARREVEVRFRKIRNLDAPPKPLRLSGNAYVLFNRWLHRMQNRSELREDSPFGTHASKYPGLFARLSLILHFMRHGTANILGVGTESAASAIEFIDGYFEPHARRVYGMVTAHPAKAGAERIASWIRADRIESFSLREVRRHDWKEFSKERDDDSILAALNFLEGQGWLKVEQKGSGPRGGRPTIRAVVNPAVFEARSNFHIQSG